VEPKINDLVKEAYGLSLEEVEPNVGDGPVTDADPLASMLGRLPPYHSRDLAPRARGGVARFSHRPSAS
jgi:hypothetical protein